MIMMLIDCGQELENASYRADMNNNMIENRIQPRIIGICEVVVTTVMGVVVLVEISSGVTDHAASGLLAVGGMFLAASLHCASIVLFRVVIGKGTLTIRSWYTAFRTVTVEIPMLDPVRFVSGGPAYTPLLVLSRGGRRLARVSAFCTNADRLETVLRGYGKWTEKKSWDDD